MPSYASWYKGHEGMGKLSDADYGAREDFTIDLPDFRDRFGASK